MLKILTAIIFTYSTVHAYAYGKHSLNWPTKISETKYKIGPLLHQFQKNDDSYFHEGIDILTPENQTVSSPVSGSIDAGYYSYKTLSNGLSQKTYISLRDINRNDLEPKLWGERYFEVSITDHKGFKFEIHHIKRESLSPQILEKIYSSDSVTAETALGKIFPWPTEVKGTAYNHIHYSIVDKEGHQRNPLWYSKKIEDTQAPKINSIFAALAQSCSFNGSRQLKELSQLRADDEVTHVVVHTEDFLNDNIFPQAPTSLTATFSDDSVFTFDYSEALFTNKLNSYALKDLFVGRFCIGPADYPLVLNGSESFNFYIQIPVPKNYNGAVKIEISDFSGNTNTKVVNI